MICSHIEIIVLIKQDFKKKTLAKLWLFVF